MNAKWRLFIILLIANISVAAQQSEVKGVVSIFNSETFTGSRKYVTNAQVTDDHGQAQPCVTDHNGYFKLIFVGVDEKTTVSFHIRAPKLEVVNIDALTAITGQHEVKQISMANPDSLAAYRLKLYEINVVEATKYLARQEQFKHAELIKLRNKHSTDLKQIKRLEQEIVLLNDQKSKVEEQAQELAKKYSVINLDDASVQVRKAYQLFNQGKLDSAQILLNTSDLGVRVDAIIEEQKRISDARKEFDKQDSVAMSRKKNILEALQLQVDLYRTQYLIDDATKTFQLLIKLDPLNISYHYDYAYFLQYTNQYKPSIDLYLKTLDIIASRSINNEDATNKLRANIAENLGRNYDAINDYQNSEKSFKLSLDILKEISKTDPTYYDAAAGRTEMEMGQLYENSMKSEDSEVAYLKAEELIEKAASKDTLFKQLQIALIRNGLGNLYSNENRDDEAEKSYRLSLQTYESRGHNDTNRYKKDLAMIYLNLGGLLEKQNKLADAELFIKKAYRLFGDLSVKQPDTFEPDFVGAQINLGNVYYLEGRLDEAEPFLKGALKKLENLAKKIPETYTPKIAKFEVNLGALYRQKNDLKQAEYYYLDALEKTRSLVKTNPQVYEPELAKILNNLGNAYILGHNYEMADTFYQEDLAIYHRLAANNPNAFEPGLALAENNLGRLYLEQKRYTASKNLLIKSLWLCKKWFEKYPSAYKIDYDNTCLNLIFVHDAIISSNQYDYFKHSATDSVEAIEPVLADRAESNMEIFWALKDYYLEKSWCLLFGSRFKQSELNARKALKLDSLSIDGTTTLANALLLQGKLKEAIIIYKKLKYYQTENGTGPEICLRQLGELEKHQIANAHFAQIKQLLDQNSPPSK